MLITHNAKSCFSSIRTLFASFMRFLSLLEPPTALLNFPFHLGSQYLCIAPHNSPVSPTPKFETMDQAALVEMLRELARAGGLDANEDR